MATRTLYAVRHGLADPLGQLTDQGREQCHHLGRRLANQPIDVVWHSPLSRARDSAAVIAEHLEVPLVDEAGELIDHVPHVPTREQVSGSSWEGFFDGYDAGEARAGRQLADQLTARFATPPAPGARSTHEVLVTHAYPIAWLVRDALGAPPQSWLSLTWMANTGVTVIEHTRGEPPAVHMVNDQSHLPAEFTWPGVSRE
ncbi:histidine phosphatase family protein [Ornithinimicrobium faecis]|uniref:Histidine phosphatase family protein n=1 Tax=Ornithinimicrobium faecis TaxID=2934158 RepID=A0ABY4YX16_9MICO|nr:histidine phosphatase family protein [Ornithinimicrobium sp. HY1793]USQ81295.1 histidine phosphatase family protein [Ornithinimicrobium sp. HY1793]